MTPRFHKLKVADIRRETDDTVSIAFQVPATLADQYSFAHGQYLTLRHWCDGEELRRSYSICSAPGEPELRVAVKKVPGGRFSTYANETLAPGAELEVMTPAGRFTSPVDPAAARRYVAFAAGSGITPVLSIVKTLLDREPHSRFHLFYGNRDSASIIFREDLEDLKNRYLGRFALTHVLSREPQDVELFAGRIDRQKVADLCRGLCPPDQVDAFFLCGPGSMIADASTALKDAGVPEDRIHFELFAAQTEPALTPLTDSHAEIEAQGDACRLSFTLDGKTVETSLPFRGPSLLDAARATGADVPYSCQSGVCASCRCKLVDGKVEMQANYSLEPWDVAAGFILSCQSRPLTDTVVIDYDEA